MFRATNYFLLEHRAKIGPLWLRLDYRRSSRKRMNFIPLSVQKYVQLTHMLGARGIDSEAIGTGRRWRYRNRKAYR